MSGRESTTGFWRQRQVRRFLPVGVGIAAAVILLLTLTLVPRHFPGYAPPAAAPFRPEPAAVSQVQAGLLREPDSRSPALRTLSRGSAITVLGQKGIWCRVSDGAGVEGYLNFRSIERDADRASRARRAEVIFAFAPLKADVAATSPLLLAPFSFAPIWGEAPQGASISVYSADHGFYAVRLADGTLGFVASRDVDLVPDDPSQPALVASRGKVVQGITVTEENGEASPGAASIAPETSASSSVPGTVSVPAPGVGAESFAMTPAVLVEKIEPAYPPAALSARLPGTVILQVTIDAGGLVSKVEVKREAPLGMTEAAVAAVKRWKYRPATGPSGALPSIKLVKVEFQPPA